MRSIRGVALGTYYAAGANAAKATPNASSMRGLVYAVKDNRDPPNPKQFVAHPLHPSPRPVAVDRTNAIEYITAMLARRISKLTSFFGAEDPRAITLVPVPSSEVTAATVETARFRTLRLCRALEGVGLGTVAVLAVQRQSFAPKPGRIPVCTYRTRGDLDRCLAFDCEASGSMGLAPGGTMEQKIYPDPYGLDTWNLAAHARVFVHIVNSDLWRDITGEAPPPTPVSAHTYTSAGLPWFALYDETHGTIAPTAKLGGVKSVKQIDATRSTKPLQDDRPVQVTHVRHLWKHGARLVDDGEW